MGYTGPESRGTSISWVKLARGESVLPPITPAVLQMKRLHRMVDIAMFARYQHTEQRERYRTGLQRWDSSAESSVGFFGPRACWRPFFWIMCWRNTRFVVGHLSWSWLMALCRQRLREVGLRIIGLLMFGATRSSRELVFHDRSPCYKLMSVQLISL